MTAEQLGQVKAMYLAGQTTTEIGDHFEVYASTIQRQLKRMGVRLRPAAPRPQRI